MFPPQLSFTLCRCSSEMLSSNHVSCALFLAKSLSMQITHLQRYTSIDLLVKVCVPRGQTRSTKSKTTTSRLPKSNMPVSEQSASCPINRKNRKRARTERPHRGSHRFSEFIESDFQRLSGFKELPKTVEKFSELPSSPEFLQSERMWFSNSREAPVRFGSVTVWGWNGSSGSGFRFSRSLC